MATVEVLMRAILRSDGYRVSRGLVTLWLRWPIKGLPGP
jgi:hypothetical protein